MTNSLPVRRSLTVTGWLLAPNSWAGAEEAADRLQKELGLEHQPAKRDTAARILTHLAYHLRTYDSSCVPLGGAGQPFTKS